MIRHVLQYSVTDEGGILTNIIWAIQMPGFMLVSGYFAAKKIDTIKGIFISFKKNANRYLVPFLIWFIGFEVLIQGRCNRNVLQGLDTLFHHVDGGLWFLWVVFVLSIVAFLCNYCVTTGKTVLSRMLSSIVVCMAFFGSLICIVILTKDINILGIKLVLYYAVFYGLGWLMKWTQQYWIGIITRYKETLLCFSLVVMMVIVYNFNLYNCPDNLFYICLRMIAGIAGNAVLFGTILYAQQYLFRCRVERIGMYTMEIYTTHMYVNHMFLQDKVAPFNSVAGFATFIVSLIVTVVLTTLIIVILKSNRISDRIFYGNVRPYRSKE